ncbi:hypothetical protein FRB93_003083 [Tulasnella sp. JGI-2019a]|nr:hypothetical protein FRB93_003083 [Tulasnella sp. JGI-2019a]
MTSRPEPHLRSIFNHAENIHKLILHDIEAPIVKNDIRLYLQTSFADIPGRLGLSIGRRWARHDEIEALVGRAETLFIVAATFARFTGDYEVKNPRQQLDLLLQRSESSFTGPDHTIDELHLQILRKIRSTTGSLHIIERLQLMMGVIVLARDPISIAAMERILGLSVGDGSRALHHLHSVISIPRSSDEYPRIHHASFPDFITDPLRCTEMEFYIQKDVHEARLATRCLGLAVFGIESTTMIQRLEKLRVHHRQQQQREREGREREWEREGQGGQGELELEPELEREREKEDGEREFWQVQRRWQAAQAAHAAERESRQREAERVQQREAERKAAQAREVRETQQELQLEELVYAQSWWWYHSSQAGRSYHSEVADLLVSSISRYLMWWFEAIRPMEPVICQTEESPWVILYRARDLASTIAAVALNAGDPRKAVEVIEHVHGTSVVQLMQYRMTLDKLHTSSPKLVSELLDLSFQLQHVNSGAEGTDTGTVWPDTIGSHRDLSERWNNVLARIQKLPGFEAFLKPTPFETLQHAATEGPVIIINVTQLRSDAIIILKTGEPVVIPLHKAIPDAIERLSRPVHESQPLGTRLEDICTIIVEPVMRHLVHALRLPDRSRIWWNPIAAAWLLPLHAAQAYLHPGPGLRVRFVSSYTPSLSALLRSDTPAMGAFGPELLLMTPTARLEVTDIINTGLPTRVTVIEGTNSTKEKMLTGLKESTWVHFTSDNRWFAKDSFKSTILSESQDVEPLTSLDIVRNDFPVAEMAFLSVGHSADGDEANNLAARMLLSGFRSVIGSMWEISDEDRLLVAREFYKYMFRNGLEGADYRDAAMALFMATQELRRMGVPLERWVNLVHYGR